MATDDDEAARKKAQLLSYFQTAGLYVLLDRAGGELTFGEADYAAVQAKHGGAGTATIHIEVARTGAGPQEITLKLVRKPPGNADLVQ